MNPEQILMGSSDGGNPITSFANSVSSLKSAFGGSGAHGAHMRNLRMMREANAFSAKQAKIARMFEERMSSTAIQRRARDLRKAGFNPLLSISSGAASTPSGNTARSVGITSSSLAGLARSQMAGHAGAITANAMNAKTNAFLAREQAKKIDADIKKISTEIKNLDVSRDLTSSQIEQVAERISLIKQEIAFTMEKTKGAKYENVARKIVAEYRRKHPDASAAQSMGMDRNAYRTIMNSIFAFGDRLEKRYD